MNRWLVIMAKEPRAGTVKTRLAAEIGCSAAAAFYRTSLANLVRRVGNDQRWRTVIAVTPDTAIHSPAIPAGTTRTMQDRGDLGARMQRMFDGLPPGPVVIVGTDIPEISAGHIACAFHALGSHDAVVGPSDDGGYWLVGMRRAPKIHTVMENVRWSSSHALADTLANMHRLKVARLNILRDVDGVGVYRELKATAARTVLPARALPTF